MKANAFKLLPSRQIFFAASLLISGCQQLTQMPGLMAANPNAPKMIWANPNGALPSYEDDANCKMNAAAVAQQLSGCGTKKHLGGQILCKLSESAEESTQYDNCMRSKGYVQRAATSTSTLPGSAFAPNQNNTVFDAQTQLKALGYNVTADGITGKQTKSAIGNFQRDNGLPVTYQLDPATLSQLGIQPK